MINNPLKHDLWTEIYEVKMTSPGIKVARWSPWGENELKVFTNNWAEVSEGLTWWRGRPGVCHKSEVGKQVKPHQDGCCGPGQEI